MNIVLATYNYYPFAWGGSEVYVHGLAKYLQNLGHTVCVIASIPQTEINQKNCINTPNFQAVEYVYDGVNVLGVSIKNEATIDIYRKFNEKWVLDWAEIIAKSHLLTQKIDILHYNGHTSVVSAAIAKAVLKTYSSCKIFASYHTPISCPNGKLLFFNKTQCNVTPNVNICTACFIKSQKDLPDMTTKTLATLLPSKQLLNILPKSMLNKIPTSLQVKKLVAESLLSFEYLDNVVHQWFVMSNYIKEVIEKQGVKTEKILMLRHGIHASFLEKTTDKEERKQSLFVYAGRFEKLKGFVTLLKAWLQLPDNQNNKQLHIIGEMQSHNSIINSLIEQAKKRKDITFVGKKTPQEIKEILQETTCMIIPSECMEIGPLVLHEAIACGANVLVSNAGGTRELAEYYKTGCNTFEMGNEQDLKEKILSFAFQPIQHQVRSQEEHYKLVFEAYKKLFV